MLSLVQEVHFILVIHNSDLWEELAWRSSCVMDCHATTWGLIPGGDIVLISHHPKFKGSFTGRRTMSLVDNELNQYGYKI